VNVIRTDRGGRATWHGPGQLVGFPVGNLRQIYGNVKAIKRFNDELLLGLAHACAVLGVKSVETRAQNPGLWTAKGKLASVGFNVKDGYIFHGFSLNVRQTCASGFTLINPCGINQCPITSLEQEGVRVDSLHDLAMKIFPYLSFYNANQALQSRTWKYETDLNELVAKVSRSAVAMEHLHSHMRNNDLPHLEQ
jgi:lipoyl(octanoyl) transferase